MLFNSFQFWIFFAVVIALYRWLPFRGQNRMLLVASYVFYGAWDWRFLSLIWFSTVVDYWASLRIQGESSAVRRRRYLVLSITVNLGLLGVFKYFDFFSRELSALLMRCGVEASLPLLHVILPVGISFYTFQTMSYTIDVYRGETQPTQSFLDFALYVCFFPQLVAGPIERSSRLLPQITQPRTVSSEDVRAGLYLVMLGMFKKVCVADNVAFVVNGVFAAPTHEISGMDCLIGVYAFAIQIYCDFSGYSSIARGISRWMGFDLMVNFDMPYVARTPSEFWRRWHISLSTWLRDYLYIPLGGNRGGRLLTIRNLMLTMLLGGLWHGAGWTFLAWGFFHGTILGIYRPFEKRLAAFTRTRGMALLQWFVMFHLVCFSWLLFRAESMEQVFAMAGRMLTSFHPSEFTGFGFVFLLVYGGPLLAFEAWLALRKRDALFLTRTHWGWRSVAYALMALMILVFQPTVNSDFIYFQF
ncbi:MAG: MBOAT family protein [Planctomycetes bacterium]|nr:MBOAT family protein [Planctomycetota bacterium]